MQDFCYNCIQNKYGNNPEIWSTDGDSIMCKIEAENVHEDTTKIKSYLTSVFTQKIWNITIMYMT